ncbi:MAG: hypothetical protein FJ189_12150 [Gammaproteobacteria bacterium]|nr:hypothetical protein [Gammaproteobacteria bacterium]
MNRARRCFLAAGILVMLGGAGIARAESDPAVLAEQLDQQWADIFYDDRDSTKAKRLEDLLVRARALKAAFPGRAEPMIVMAVVLCSLAGVDWGLDSLSRVEQARQLLAQAIDLDPRAMEGAAYIALGNLYWRMPGWPISFGDDQRAKQYLANAVFLFPTAIDSNFFMADFLIDQGEYRQARPFLEQAERAPIRAVARVSDAKLKQEIVEARRVIDEKGGARSGFFARLLPDFSAK